MSSPSGFVSLPVFESWLKGRQPTAVITLDSLLAFLNSYVKDGPEGKTKEYVQQNIRKLIWKDLIPGFRSKVTAKKVHLVERRGVNYRSSLEKGVPVAAAQNSVAKYCTSAGIFDLAICEDAADLRGRACGGGLGQGVRDGQHDHHGDDQLERLCALSDPGSASGRLQAKQAGAVACSALDFRRHGGFWHRNTFSGWRALEPQSRSYDAAATEQREEKKEEAETLICRRYHLRHVRPACDGHRRPGVAYAKADHGRRGRVAAMLDALNLHPSLSFLICIFACNVGFCILSDATFPGGGKFRSYSLAFGMAIAVLGLGIFIVCSQLSRIPEMRNRKLPISFGGIDVELNVLFFANSRAFTMMLFLAKNIANLLCRPGALVIIRSSVEVEKQKKETIRKKLAGRRQSVAHLDKFESDQTDSILKKSSTMLKMARKSVRKVVPQNP